MLWKDCSQAQAIEFLSQANCYSKYIDYINLIQTYRTAVRCCFLFMDIWKWMFETYINRYTIDRNIYHEIVHLYFTHSNMRPKSVNDFVFRGSTPTVGT